MFQSKDRDVMDYKDFERQSNKALYDEDRDTFKQLLSRKVRCPGCKEVVIPQVGWVKPSMARFIRCPQCEAFWTLMKEVDSG